LKQTREAVNVVKFFDVEDLRKADAEIIGEVHVEGKYKSAKKLSDLKEPFFLDLADSLKGMQTPEKMNHLSEKAWKGGMYEKCFESGFQQDAVIAVVRDREKYFSHSLSPEDPVLAGQQEASSLLQQAADAHEDDTFHTERNDAQAPSIQLIGRQVKSLNGLVPGVVNGYNSRNKIFSVRYAKSGAKRASKILKDVCRSDLLKLLWYPEEAACEREENQQEDDQIIPKIATTLETDDESYITDDSGSKSSESDRQSDGSDSMLRDARSSSDDDDEVSNGNDIMSRDALSGSDDGGDDDAANAALDMIRD
jgi:hypothetical protein